MRYTTLLTVLAITSVTASAADRLHLPPKGKANGKKVVLVAGDEEYRSEESCPMLAKILSQKHGFECTVLFSQNPDGGFVDPNCQTNIPGSEALDSADLMIIGTRFRQLPPDQIENFAEFLDAGKPVVGFRTATHAFRGNAQTGSFKWNDFGFQILGERWVAHHGAHGRDGTVSVGEAANAGHVVLKGVGEIFGPTDVYTVKNLDLNTATLLLRGAVTESMTSAKPANTPKNNPMMPLAWLREYTAPNGTAKGKAFCTTMGSSGDFADEDLRRLVVNVSLHFTGQPVPDKADVAYVDSFEPTPFRAIGDKDFYKNRNLKPEDYALGKSPATGTPDKAKPEEKKADAAAPGQAMNGAPDNAPHAKMPVPGPATEKRPQAVATPQKGERVVFIGNGLAERDVYYSRLETELHLRWPDSELYVRNMARMGDTPGFRPHPSRNTQWAFPGADKFHSNKKTHNGKGFFPMPDEWLAHLKADTIVAFFGYNESFDGAGKAANFEAELDAWVQHTLSRAYNGKAAPRVVLVSPIAFEDLSKTRDLPNGEAENASLLLYTQAMQNVAKKHGLTFIDLFTPTKAAYAQAKQPFTADGFMPTDSGYQQLAKWLADGLFGKKAWDTKPDPKLVHEAVKQKDWFWQNDYHILNGVHTHGQRYNPFGPQNYPDEVKKAREMMALRDDLIHAVATGKKKDLAVDDSKTHQLPPVPTNYTPTNSKNGAAEYKYGEDAVKALVVPEGYKVEMFASEKEFPKLANPMQMSFDNKGRLWVGVMPTYPHYRPGDPLPNDKILIYEDTNGDGKADKEIVWADNLHMPIGIEFAPEGVYVAQEPNLVLLRDTNGDDKCDSREIILGGFDTHDTHHAISAFGADPSGAFMMCEGVFLHSNIETAYGPVRCVDGGFYRYSPQRRQLERTVQMGIPNPWGVAFDRWGQDFLLHTSGPTMNWMLPVSVKPTFGSKTPSAPDLIPQGQAVRPTSGLEIVSSRHFPDEVQGDIILCNAIGFLGIKQHKIEDDGTGWKTTFRQNLLQSMGDGNFRPVDLEFAPDGSLYVIDWHNVLIGHMQHNARDPLRDHVHGRIYRITYPSRPLVKPAKVAGATIPELLENLKLPEDRVRCRSRRELRGRDAAEVLAATKAWAAKQTEEHAKLEALWVTWGLNMTDDALLRQLLQSPDFHARSAAVRVLRYNMHRTPDHAALLEKAANDEHGRVRLEAIVAASWMSDIASAKKIVAAATAKGVDVWSEKAAQTAADRLAGMAEQVVMDHPVLPAPAHLDEAGKKQYLLGQEVYFRDAHCATCHQPTGKGLDPAFPSLEKSPWVTGDDERLIKLTLKGLMGPLELNGKKYDGTVPMTPFGGLLKDEEIAAVLTFVRNSFGNQAPPITLDQVKKVREAADSKATFYTVEELLKEHPMK
jgi:mono/diheme cytochrome c family protein/glucose/arabinose dehydrogenase/type 1 glutamine amidotransferase